MKKDKTIYSAMGIILFFICGINMYATNYYVSNSGNDTSNGTSPATAWATISKVNSSTFSPGDSIKFKCGDRWFESLTLSASGNSSNYIVITSYGTGAKPKLYGSISVTSFTAHTRSNIYRINNLVDYDLYYGIPGSSSRASIYFIVNGVTYWGDNDQAHITSFDQLTSNYMWYWQNDSLYFYYDGNINDIDTIEVTQKAWGITLGGEYITIDGLDMRYWASRCIGVNNYPEVTKHGFQLLNCHLAYTASREESVGYGCAIGYSDMIIDDNVIHDNGRRNISVNLVASTGNAIMRDVIIQRNTLYNGFHTTGIDMSMHASDQYIRNIVIRQNLIYDKYGGNGYQSESIFLQNYDGVADDSHFDSIYIYNNVIQNTTLDGVYMEHQGPHVYIINNTVTAGNDETRAFIFNTTSNAHHTIMNNIFCNYPGYSVPVIDGASDHTSILDTCDYNLCYTAQNYNSTYLWYQMYAGNYYYNQWASIQALGFETHSPIPQPICFVDSIVNVNLKPTSPAIRAAKPISFVTTDFDGNPRDPLYPDIGAFEYIPDIPNDVKLAKSQNSTLSLYPNPVSNNSKIELSGEWNDNYIIQLYNICGIKVFEREYSNGKIQTINVADFPKGTYFIIISDNLKFKTAKIIIK